MSIKFIRRRTGVLGKRRWGNRWKSVQKKKKRVELGEKFLMSLAHSLPPPEIRESGINGLEKKKGEKFRQELQTLKTRTELRT